MSQEKVDAYKAEKANRKNWKKEQQRKKIITWSITAVCVVAIVVICILVNRVDYSSINQGVSVYDDVATANLVGYSGVSLSDVLSSIQ